MSKLIQALLNLDHPQRHGASNQHPVLAQEVFCVYQDATESMWQNRQGFTQDYRATEEKILNNIHIRVTAELDAMNLHRMTDYRRIQRVVLNWNPDKSQSNFRECVAIKKSLIICLADARKKQRLNRLCNEYKAHLATEIRSELTHDFPNISRQYGLNLPEPMGLFKKPLRPGTKPSTLDHFLVHDAKSLPIANNPGLGKAIQKYQAVTTLQHTLLTHRPAPTQIQEFGQTLERQKSVLEAHRDSTAMRFLKRVTAVVTLGIAAALGIFGVKGQQAVQKMRVVATQQPSRPGL